MPIDTTRQDLEDTKEWPMDKVDFKKVLFIQMIETNRAFIKHPIEFQFKVEAFDCLLDWYKDTQFNEDMAGIKAEYEDKKRRGKGSIFFQSNEEFLIHFLASRTYKALVRLAHRTGLLDTRGETHKADW